MASGTITGSTGNQYIEAKVVWSSTPYTEHNYSVVNASLYYRRTNDYTTYGTGTFYITIGGVSTQKINFISFSDDQWVKAADATVEIDHDDDGTKAITISASGMIKGTTLTSTSVSGEVRLDIIARASIISSAAPTQLGTSCSVKWFALSSVFHYRLRFELGEWVMNTSVISPGSVKECTYKSVIPLTVAEQLPKAAKGSMKVTLYTYSDTAGKKQIGEADSKTFTVTVPNNSDTKPSINLELSAFHSLGEDFEGLYIKERSKVSVSSYNALGKYGATIASYEFYVAGKKCASSVTSDYLMSAGTIKVKGRVTDTRGYTSEMEKNITVIDYSPPVVLPATNDKAIVCARCYADGTLAEDGTYLRIIAKRSYSKVMSDGEQYNFCTMRYRYRPEGTNTYSSWRVLLDGEDTEADTVDSGAIEGVVSSTETTYFVQVSVVDELKGTDAVQFTVPTDFVTIDCPEEFNGRRMGLFRHVSGTTEDGLYVGLPIFGGSVDSLKLGTRLTATAAAPISLDDVKTPGIYYSPNAENSKYIANTPHTEGGFGLEVRELQHKDYIRQTVYFGRTTIWRHYNGTEWSDFVRVMVSTEFDTACTDFVIETGTSGGWTYKKWKNGTYEMFGEFDVAPGTSTLNGTVYRTGSIAIPAPFTIEDAMVSGTAVGFYWLSNGGKSGTNAVNIRIISDKAITASTIAVRLHVVGTYA